MRAGSLLATLPFPLVIALHLPIACTFATTVLSVAVTILTLSITGVSALSLHLRLRFSLLALPLPPASSPPRLLRLLTFVLRLSVLVHI